MKEATGELSTTVITVVAIAAILSLFTVFLYPQLKGAILARTHCAQAVNCTQNGNKRTCHYYLDNMTESTQTIECPLQDNQTRNEH